MKLLHLLIAIAVMLGVATLWLRNQLATNDKFTELVTKQVRNDAMIAIAEARASSLEELAKNNSLRLKDIKEINDEIAELKRLVESYDTATRMLWVSIASSK